MNAVKNPSQLYTAQRRIRHIEKPDFFLTELELAQHQFIPWHTHTAIRDTFYVLQGKLRVTMLDPSETVEVETGDTFAVPGGRPHHVVNVGEVAATFLLLQGVGKVDFVPFTNTDAARE